VRVSIPRSSRGGCGNGDKASGTASSTTVFEEVLCPTLDDWYDVGFEDKLEYLSVSVWGEQVNMSVLYRKGI